ATVGKWLKREGDPVAAGEALVELETDKVSVEVTAPQAGVLEKIIQSEGQNVTIGEVLGMVGEGGAAQSPNGGARAPEQASEAVAATRPPAAETPAAAPATDGEQQQRVAVSPVAQRVANSAGVDPRTVVGSGPGGRVTKGDVVAQVGSSTREPATTTAEARPNAPQPTSAPAAPQPAPQAAPAAASSDGRPEERVRMSRRRQTIAARLVQAQQTAAMLTTFNEVDMTAIMDIRKRRRDAFKERNKIGLGFMSFFTKAVIGALKIQPLLNAEIQGDEIVIKRYYDIGIAVSTEEGLVVPVVRDADRKSFAEIERSIDELARKAREGKLSISDLQGGTFTITNGGIFGSLMSTPILNAPQVGILGMHKIQERPMVVAGEIKVRPMMYLALSYDHRIVDGAEAVRFLVRVKELLEDPETLLLEG
ncbi:MAG TPA: 2-oxoglutarate dehydrogenase complex dihydrolipoyllysine-residue succinyltransferase, partial [Roseiflexaceae bacterium]|nr:2-oxoglutarate dehydrogenase complex dihydrolipoyllysine-residue succinyltransferase [Roseiflexaceae bacterium]